MFGRRKIYKRVSFPPEVIEKGMSEFFLILQEAGDKFRCSFLNYSIDDQDTMIKNPVEHDRRIGFLTDNFSFYIYSDADKKFSLVRLNQNLVVMVDDVDSLAQADRILHVFNRDYSVHQLPPEETLKGVTVFVGHGRNSIWRDLKDHLQDKHGIKVIAYETGARAGYTIQEVLQEISSEVSIAFLVHTGEDIDRDGIAHARENVVHETGLFQGKLSFKRSIILLEDGCNEFSNISGLQQLRFQKGNIKEIFGDVLAVLRREFAGE